jgi:localization factor PodJL
MRAPAAETALAEPGVGPSKLRRAAAAGDPAAAFEIAARYAEGNGTRPDLAMAAEWYHKAAESGLAVAQYRLGSLYERGQGVTKDGATAVVWYQHAADQGNVGAMHNLAVMMSQGVDGPPDNSKAFEWFLAAANYGVKDSQYNLGVLYARGLGTKADLVESYKWFAVAAAAGDKDAGQRRDEVAKALSPEDLIKARAATKAWHATPVITDANTVATPDGGWEDATAGVTEGDGRDLVKKVQALLAEQGYDPGPADGFEGPKTRDAIRAFQRTFGMSETGLISADLAKVLSNQST